MRIRVIRLLPHPWGIFSHIVKLEIFYIEARKQLLAILRSKNSEKIDHSEEVIHPK